MVNDMIDEDNSQGTTQQYEYEFLDGDDRKSFLCERPPHVLYLWHLAHKYGILQTVRQQLEGGSSVDGSNVPEVDTTRNKKRKHSPESRECSLSESVNITKKWNKSQIQSMDLLGLQDRVKRCNKSTCSTDTERSWKK